MCQYSDDFTPTLLNAKIDSIYNVIQPDVYADPLKMYTNQNFEDDILSTTNIPGLKSFITNRYNSVLNQLDSIGCPSVVGVNDLFKTSNNGIRIYPNPFGSRTTIEFENLNSGKYVLTLYNSTGQLVRKIDNITTGKIVLEKQGLSNGFYFFHLMDNNGIVGHEKLIIE